MPSTHQDLNITLVAYPSPHSLLEKGVVKPMVEPDVPKVPMDYTWAKRLGLVRKPANFISSISDDRGDELRSVLRAVRDSWLKSMLVSAAISDGFPSNHSA